MAKKKRPSLANYLVTGKVHWEPDEPSPSEEAPEEEAAPAPPQKSAEQLERESRFLAMLSDSDRSEWAPRFDARESCFDSLQVKELRSAFEEGRLEGRILKLRRRRSPLEPVETGKDLSFPILAVLLETDDSITLWCNHLD